LKKPLFFLLGALACTPVFSQSFGSNGGSEHEAAPNSPLALSVQFLERLGCQQRKAQGGSSGSECDAAQDDIKEAAKRADGVMGRRVQKLVEEDNGRGTIRWRSSTE